MNECYLVLTWSMCSLTNSEKFCFMALSVWEFQDVMCECLNWFTCVTLMVKERLGSSADGRKHRDSKANEVIWKQRKWKCDQSSSHITNQKTYWIFKQLCVKILDRKSNFLLCTYSFSSRKWGLLNWSHHCTFKNVWPWCIKPIRLKL